MNHYWSDAASVIISTERYAPYLTLFIQNDVAFILYLYPQFCSVGSANARWSNINKPSDNPVMDLFLRAFPITSTDLMGFSRLTIMMK